MGYITCFTLKEKKHSCSIFTVFAYQHLCTAMFIFFRKALTIVTKSSILDVAGILNPPQYALTRIAYRNNLIQVTDEG